MAHVRQLDPLDRRSRARTRPVFLVVTCLVTGVLPLAFGAPTATTLPAAAAAADPSAVPLQEFISDHDLGRIWNSYNQSQNGHGPELLGAPSAVVVGATIHVYGETAAGDLTEFANDGLNGRVWNAYDLTSATGTGPLSGPPHAITVANRVDVFARSSSGDLVGYRNNGMNGRTWNSYDLSTVAGGTLAPGVPDPIESPSNGQVHVYVEGANGDLVEYTNDGANGRAWNAYDLSTGAGGGSPINGQPSALYNVTQNRLYVLVRSAGGDLVEYVADFLAGRSWNAYDLSVAAGGGPLGGVPDALYHPTQGLMHIYVQNANGDMIEYVNDGLNGRSWNAYDLSVYATNGSFIAGQPDALFLPDQGLVHLYVRGANNDLYEYVNDGIYGRVWSSYDLSTVTYGGPSIGTDPTSVEWAGLAHVYVGGPTSMGGTVISNVSAVPNSPYPPGSRVVALSFDDGPSPAYTPQILGVLEAYRAPATFEVVGSVAAGYLGILRQEEIDGFGLANHTWDHVDLTRQSAAGWVAEVDRTSALISSVSNRAVSCLRPPYGYTNGAVLAQLSARGLGEFMWDIDPSDYTLPGAGAIAQRVLGALHPGAVIILHDGGGNRSETVAALPAIINGIRAAGYSIVSVCG